MNVIGAMIISLVVGLLAGKVYGEVWALPALVAVYIACLMLADPK